LEEFSLTNGEHMSKKNFLIMLCFLLPVISKANPGKLLFENRCASCHANGNEALKTPILHGQEKRYLIQTLNEFKAGTRKDNILNTMNTIAGTLSEQDIQDVSQYLAAQDICDVTTNLDSRAEGWIEKFRDGQKVTEAKNCMHCHGSFHHSAPRLYGQTKSYMAASIDAFKKEKRPGFFKMVEIAKTLSENETENITHYLNGMRLMRECP
jgi:cytochrome c553